MQHNLIPLNILPMGEKAKVKALALSGPDRRRLLDLGLIINTVVEALSKSPSGDPVAYYIRGAVIAIRLEDAAKILVEAI